MIRAAKWAASFLVLACAATNAAAAGDATFAPERAAVVDRLVEARMAEHGAVGVAVGVIEEGNIVYLQAYGLADREAGRPVDLSTVFNWASNCKPMAAVLAVQLAEQGRLDLDADVRKYVPEFPAKEKTITIRHLLSHTSGLPHYSNGVVRRTPGAPATRPTADEDAVTAIQRFGGSPLLFEPGEKYEYSTYAFILASAAIERAGGASYDEQVRARVARPLGMRSLQLDTDPAGHDDWAVGYVKNDAGEIVRARGQDHYWKYGAGGYKSTIGDFARWAQGLMNHRLVGEQGERLMWTPQRTNDGNTIDCGLGFRITDDGHGPTYHHSGGQDEASSFMLLSPGTGRGVVVLCNTRGIPAGELARAICAELKPSPAQLAQPVGH